MNRPQKSKLWWVGLLATVAIHYPLSGQDSNDDSLMDEDIYELSPFEITTEDDGYTASQTLGGTRIRTDYKDLSTPLSAITSKFLSDTGATGSESLLTYTTNTEVGGLYGNWGGVGSQQGASDRDALMRPDNTTRVRGLDSADNTRGFFLTDIPWDSYNTDRVEIQRGPNSILFGVGSPAGIINTTTITAKMDGNSGKVEHQFAQFNSNRMTADYNIEIIDDVLAIRVAALMNHQKFRQKPAFKDDERLFMTGTWQQQVLPKEWAGKLQFRFSAETAKVTSNNPRYMPPTDGYSLWFDDNGGDGTTDLIGWDRQVRDMFIYSTAGGGDVSRGTEYAVTDPIWLPGASAIDSGDLNNGGVGFFYQNGSDIPFFVSRQAIGNTTGAMGTDGTLDGTIDNLPYASPLRVSGYNNYTIQVNNIDNALGIPEADGRFPGADRGYYKDRSMTDDSVFDFYNQLIDGDNKREHKKWDAINLSLSQTFLQDRIGVEAVYDKQTYSQWRSGVTWNNPYISIDVNQGLQNIWSQYESIPNPSNDNPDRRMIVSDSLHFPGFTPTADQPYPNANAGSAFIGGSFSSNNRTDIERESWRVTAFGEFRGSDIFEDGSWLSRLIGSHSFTALLANDNNVQKERIWDPSGVEYDWAYENSNNGASTAIGLSTRGVTPIVYLSGPLFNVSNPSGLNLGPIDTIYNPSGSYTVDYFDMTWVPSMDPNDPTYVDPAGQWTTLQGDPNGVQADNPYNYVGRVTETVNFLNADDGDIDKLTTGYTETETDIESKGLVWQGKLLDGLIIPTYGWRRDYLKTYTYTAANTTTTAYDPYSGVVSTEGGERLMYSDPVKGENRSWGVVAHMPDSWLENIPVLNGLSAYYNRGNNQRVMTRYNYDGESLANPSATSTDYGIVLSLLDEKLSIKFGKYKTEVKNANLAGGSNMLGNNMYVLYNLEAWGTSNSLSYLYGMNGLEAPGQDWKWNWALIDNGWNSAYAPGTDLWENNESTIAQKAAIDAWITGLDQDFFDNYDIPVDVNALKDAYQHYLSTGDIGQVVAVGTAAGFPPGSGTADLSSQNNGLINGISPNGTIDTTSKGYELEINYRPIPNWNIQLNASKTDAYREDLGQPMLDFIEKQWARLQGPAGDIRMWWGGDVPMRNSYRDNIISNVEFQNESVGSQAPELRPYSGSLITNYAFTESVLEGFNIGGALRYQDAQILGYRLKDDNSGLDVNKPIFGDSETHLDIWAGYQRAINDKVDWRIQVNIRNVGENVGLVPIAVNPDGTTSYQRIQEGMGWSVSNTFSF